MFGQTHNFRPNCHHWLCTYDKTVITRAVQISRNMARHRVFTSCDVIVGVWQRIKSENPLQAKTFSQRLAAHHRHPSPFCWHWWDYQRNYCISLWGKEGFYATCVYFFGRRAGTARVWQIVLPSVTVSVGIEKNNRMKDSSFILVFPPTVVAATDCISVCYTIGQVTVKDTISQSK